MVWDSARREPMKWRSKGTAILRFSASTSPERPPASRPAGLLAEGDASWAKAQSLFGGTAPAPLVEELPSTELFRQTTNEPGWMLASTQGNAVFLQPAPVRRNNGSDEALLLHEFLHVPVEQQAGKTGSALAA